MRRENDHLNLKTTSLKTEIRFSPVYVNLIGQVVSSNHVTARLDPCHLIFGASPAMDCLANILKETIRLANGLAAWSPALADVFSNLQNFKVPSV